MKQKWLGNQNKKFDLNFLFCGNSGSGKTHFAATYTGGPIHFYMLDRGGEKTLEKLLSLHNNDKSPITIDNLASSENPFSALWLQIQKDEKEGFFDYLAENKGLLVLDSITSANEKAIEEILTKDNVKPPTIGKKIDHKKGMSMPHWGQLLSWMQLLTAAFQEMPCATIINVHLHTLMNSNQEVVARYPSVSGQFKQLLSKDFDETYLLEARGNNHIIHFKERYKFEAKSRIFNQKEVRNATLDDLVNAYLTNKNEIEIKK